MHPVRLSPNELITRLTRLIQRMVGEGIGLEIRLAPNLPDIQGDINLTEQAILNLVVNARDAMPGGGQLVLSTLVREVDDAYAQRVPHARPGRWVGVQVSDTGRGVAPDWLENVYTSVAEALPRQQPLALGVATACGAVQQQGGWLEAESQPGQGTQLQAWFPVMPTVMAIPLTVTPRGQETVLVVEDKDTIRAIVRTVLERQGYRVLLAANGVDALNLWQQHKTEVALLFTDVVMPGGVTGKDLADQLRLEQPDLKVVFCSGYGAEIVGPDIVNLPNNRYLAKPFDIQHLLDVVRGLLDDRSGA